MLSDTQKTQSRRSQKLAVRQQKLTLMLQKVEDEVIESQVIILDNLK